MGITGVILPFKTLLIIKMAKRGEIISVIIIVGILASLNLFLYLSKGNFSYSNFSGMAISEIPKLPQGINFSVIAFVVQWGLLLLIVIIAYLRHLKHKKEEDIKINYSKIKTSKGKSSTDLDVLYDLLKNKKRLKINIIAKTFKITNDKALEWAKILENSELGVIEYPAFNEPEIRLKEENENGGEGKIENMGEKPRLNLTRIEEDIKEKINNETKEIEKFLHIKHDEKDKVEKKAFRKKGR